MSTVAGAKHAWAWSAWARPISPPSAVTAALFDMFCGLNGRTRSPRLAQARASAATSTDFPTSEPVPCSISARAAIAMSELDAGLRLHPSGKVVFCQPHLGHQVGNGDELRLGIAAGDHDMQPRPPSGKRRDDRRQVEIVVAQGDIELVENDEAETRVGRQLAGL